MSGPARSAPPAAALFGDSAWQMSFGERAALEGVLSALEPRLAIEIGTAEGGSLARLAEHCGEVHSFDLVTPQIDVGGMPNVHLHTGDSHALLPDLLGRLAEQGRNVDFVLVDGDHSADGVKRDMLDLLESDAVRRTVILAHDSMNDVVRDGLDQVDYAAFGKVARVDMDFFPGFVFREPVLEDGQLCWGGLGLVLVDDAREGGGGPEGAPFPWHTPRELNQLALSALSGGGGVAALAARLEQAETARHEQWQAREAMRRSVSWRITAPLRAAKRAARGPRGRG